MPKKSTQPSAGGIGELIMAKGKQAKKPQAKAKPAKAPHGQVGPQTYEDVRKIVDAKGIPLVRAFDEVAKATGRKASTIAVTYYTIAKKKGLGRTAKLRKSTAPVTGRGKGMPGSSVQSILSGVSAAIAKLEGVIAEQAREIERLRGESLLAQRLRTMLNE